LFINSRYARCERYSKGVLNCNEAIRLSPNLVRAYLYRGCLKYSLRLYNHAIIDLTKALEIDPSCSHAYYNRALCYIRRGNLSYAFKDFAIVLCLASSVTNSKTQLLELETYVNRGLLHYEHKDFDNALNDFEQALHLVLTSSDEKKINALKHKLIYTIGQCHHRLAQFDKAIEQFSSSEKTDKAMNDMNYRHDLWIAQGNVYMDMSTDKSRMKATILFEHVLHENPLQEHARLNLGYCLRQRGYYQRAWTQFAALLRFNPTHVRALEARALFCLQMNHPTEAFIDLNQALRFEPSSAQLLTNRGVIQQFLGDNRNAMCDYRAAMLADPQNAFAHYNAGNILMFHGQFQQAMTLFDRVLEINPRDEAALTNRAIAKAVLKQYTSAREDLEHALQISPLSAHIHVDLGQLLLTMDKPTEAEEYFSRALEIRPCDPAVYKWRGDARSKQDGKRQVALDDYRICVELNDALQLARKHGLIKAPTKTRRRL
jgi:tetratricopeptide (TPR) repeat protein